VQRFATVIRLKPEMETEYRALHEAVWPAVLETIRACHIGNYSIFLKDGLLFGYFEYLGIDWAADSARMAADDATQRWWALTRPCQEPLETREPDEWWASMVEVFHAH